MKANLWIWVLLALSITVSVAEQPFDFIWAQRAGGFPNSLAIDGQKNTYVCGYFYGTALFGSTNITSTATSAFLAKHDGEGNFQWVRALGSDSYAEAGAVAVNASGGVYVAGRFHGVSVSFGNTNLTSNGGGIHEDLFLAKYDTNGTFLWVQQFPGRPSTSRAVTAAAVDGTGNIYITGNFAQGATFGAFSLSGNVNGSLFLAKFDSNGTCLWARAASGSLGTYAQGLATDPAGNPILTGHFQGSGSFGTNNLSSAGSWDIFLMKYNPTGDVLWVRQAGGADDDYGYGVAVDSGSNIFSVGMFRNTASFGSTNLTSVGYHDGFITRYSTDGLMSWIRPVRGQASQGLYAFSVGLDSSGNAYLAGEFKGSAVFGFTNLVSNETGQPQYFGDIYVAKCSSVGDFLWATKAGGSSFDAGRVIVLDASGNPYVAGYFSGTANFGQTNLTSTGAGMFLGKLDVIPSPSILSLKMYAGLLIQGTPGGTYAIQYVTNLQQTNIWQTLTTIKMTNASQFWFDVDSPMNPQRFYRSVP